MATVSHYYKYALLATGGTLTQAWIEDRAAFLVAKNGMYTVDRPFAVAAHGTEPWHYEDKALGHTVPVSVPVLGFEQQVPDSPRLAVFGGAGADALEGEDEADRLYGGGGDTLSSGAAHLGEPIMHAQTATRVSCLEVTS